MPSSSRLTTATMTDDARPHIIVTEHLDPACLQWLSERAHVERCAADDPQFNTLLASADGLVIRTYTQVDDALLARAPRLRVVARAGVGLDNVDKDACAARDVTVLNTPDANTVAVVEYVWALIFDALRPRATLTEALAPEAWAASRASQIATRQASDCTLGLLGMGRVGQRMARVAAAFDVRVIYNDLLEIPAAQRSGATPVDVDTLFRDADIVSLHIDGRASNRHFVHASHLAQCRDDVVFINASRGFVVDPDALAAFMSAHPAAAAALDVHDPEPIDASSPLLGLPNVRLLPHLGAATATAHRNMSWVVRDVMRVLTGEAD